MTKRTATTTITITKGPASNMLPPAQRSRLFQPRSNGRLRRRARLPPFRSHSPRKCFRRVNFAICGNQAGLAPTTPTPLGQGTRRSTSNAVSSRSPLPLHSYFASSSQDFEPRTSRLEPRQMADDFAQTVKQQVDIVRIVGEYLKLRKTGAQNYTGLCPFHKEKTGSFSVNATHGYYYCFGCHEKGDVFTFVMYADSLSFPEAVRAVATKAGIPLPKREFSSPEEAREAGLRRQLIDIHEAATQYLEAQLKSPEAARARDYLTGRAVSPETVKTFRIGYAPDDFNHMRDALKPHFSEEVMRASGLFSAKDQADGSPGSMYARFRKRITFPIANEAGKIIAFTARALDPDEKNAKYLNSPESALYTKGHVLFNLDKAKVEMRKSDFAVLVEGQMDCISVYMAGIHNVVATSGTAFTET